MLEVLWIPLYAWSDKLRNYPVIEDYHWCEFVLSFAEAPLAIKEKKPGALGCTPG
jgi:hypothetical protein